MEKQNIGWTLFIEDGITHVIPVKDLQDHSQEIINNVPIVCLCKCEPRIITDYKTIIIVHSSFDGREGAEWFRELLKNNT